MTHFIGIEPPLRRKTSQSSRPSSTYLRVTPILTPSRNPSTGKVLISAISTCSARTVRLPQDHQKADGSLDCKGMPHIQPHSFAVRKTLGKINTRTTKSSSTMFSSYGKTASSSTSLTLYAYTVCSILL